MSEVPNEAALKEAHEAALSQADAVRSLKASLKEGSAQKVGRTAFDNGYSVRFIRHAEHASWLHQQVGLTRGMHGDPAMQ